jgi:hypothetical protein
MPSPFETDLVRVPPPLPPLPLTHGTTLRVLEAIVTSVIGGNRGTIEPRACPIFHRPLVYTFYARPAYMKAGGDYENDPAGLPIFLVLDGNLIGDASMIYPFDTGRYEFYPFAALLEIADFRLSNGITSVGNVIATFYESVSHYYWIHPKHAPVRSKAQTVVGYYRMLTAGHDRPEDGRESSIEIAFDFAIDLETHLRLALVPRLSGTMTHLRPALEALGCADVSYYSWTGRYRRSDFRQYLWDRIADHLKINF